jgi:hypothetical protein
MIDTKVKIHCTDNNKDLEAHVLNYRPRAFLEVAFQTIKLRMVYKEDTKVFFGNLMGREFTIKEDALPKEQKDFRR